jgi:hypothetical protein
VSGGQSPRAAPRCGIGGAKRPGFASHAKPVAAKAAAWAAGFTRRGLCGDRKARVYPGDAVVDERWFGCISTPKQKRNRSWECCFRGSTNSVLIGPFPHQRTEIPTHRGGGTIGGQANDFQTAGFTGHLAAAGSEDLGRRPFRGRRIGPFDDDDIGSKSQMGTAPTRFGSREQLQRYIATYAPMGSTCTLIWSSTSARATPVTSSFATEVPTHVSYRPIP